VWSGRQGFSRVLGHFAGFVFGGKEIRLGQLHVGPSWTGIAWFRPESRGVPMSRLQRVHIRDSLKGRPRWTGPRVRQATGSFFLFSVFVFCFIFVFLFIL
jgi:hypothetical protein